MSTVGSLLGRTVILVAHPDDECIAYGALLQRMREPRVIYATDGAPRDRQFWQKWGTREAYAELRREESLAALARVGVNDVEYLSDDAEHAAALVDQELYLALPQAYRLLRDRIAAISPNTIATLAYEGGHPDHDSCNLLAWALGQELRIQVWEAPLYRRNESGEGVVQRFVSGDAGVEIAPTAEEAARKTQMCLEYGSQGDFLRTFDLQREVVRPLAQYDYSQPPHSGKLNYELWRWRMTGSEVSAEFVRFLRWWQLRQRQAA